MFQELVIVAIVHYRYFLSVEYKSILCAVPAGTARFRHASSNRQLSGNVQLLYRGEWLNVEVSVRRQETANVTCQQMGFPSGGFVVDLDSSYDHWHLRSVHVSCDGSEIGLLSCTLDDHLAWVWPYLGEKLAVRCYGNSGNLVIQAFCIICRSRIKRKRTASEVRIEKRSGTFSVMNKLRLGIRAD